MPTLSHCRRCRSTNLRYSWQTFRNGSRHIRVDCAACKAFQRFAQMTLSAIDLAEATEKQTDGLEFLEFLVILHDLRIEVQNFGYWLGFRPREAMTPELKGAAKRHRGLLKSMLKRVYPGDSQAKAA